MHPAITKVSCVFSVFLLGISAAHAGGAHQTWTVVEASGTVHIKSAAGADLGARAGTRLHTPFKIVTGAKGRAVISHGQDRVTVGPDSRSTVAQPTPSKTGLVTRIKEMLGSVLYHVQHRPHGDFQVDTPYLVSVVKGTTFNVHVTPDASTVALVEGKLWVYTPNGKFQRMLTPGQAAIKSVHSKGIMLKDQQSLSEPVRGPITVVGDGDTPKPVGAAANAPSSALAHASGKVPVNASLPNGIGSAAAGMHIPPMVGDRGMVNGG
ncbi:MAG TPA: FecR family protein, partial [Pseudodesulfovibrio sp.]|nr:FecR family protein [Pseudodesulfovibrio sp.]